MAGRKAHSLPVSLAAYLPDIWVLLLSVVDALSTTAQTTKKTVIKKKQCPVPNPKAQKGKFSIAALTEKKGSSPLSFSLFSCFPSPLPFSFVL